PSTARASASRTSRMISWTLMPARSPRGLRSLLDDRFAQCDRDGLRAVVGLELGEDVPHVALDGLLADEELLGHVGVRHAVSQQLQDLALAAGDQALPRELEQRGCKGRINEVLTACNTIDGAHDGVVAALLEHVAAGSRLAAALQQVALGVCGEEDD